MQTDFELLQTYLNDKGDRLSESLQRRLQQLIIQLDGLTEKFPTGVSFAINPNIQFVTLKDGPSARFDIPLYIEIEKLLPDLLAQLKTHIREYNGSDSSEILDDISKISLAIVEQQLQEVIEYCDPAQHEFIRSYLLNKITGLLKLAVIHAISPQILNTVISWAEEEGVKELTEQMIQDLIITLNSSTAIHLTLTNYEIYGIFGMDGKRKHNIVKTPNFRQFLTELSQFNLIAPLSFNVVDLQGSTDAATSTAIQQKYAQQPETEVSALPSILVGEGTVAPSVRVSIEGFTIAQLSPEELLSVGERIPITLKTGEDYRAYRCKLLDFALLVYKTLTAYDPTLDQHMAHGALRESVSLAGYNTFHVSNPTYGYTSVRAGMGLYLNANQTVEFTRIACLDIKFLFDLISDLNYRRRISDSIPGSETAVVIIKMFLTFINTLKNSLESMAGFANRTDTDRANLLDEVSSLEDLKIRGELLIIILTSEA